MVEEYVCIFSQLEESSIQPKLLEEAKERFSRAIQKKSKLLDYNIAGQITDADYLMMNQKVMAEIEETQKEIEELEQQLTSREEFDEHMQKIRAVLREA